MHSLIRVHSLLLALLVLHSHPRIGGHAKTIAPSTAKPAPKTDSSKITPRNSAPAANQIFAVRPDAEGKTTLTCQCVVYHHCDVQDVYYPTASESHIKCGNLEACCTRPLFTETSQQSAASTSSNSSDICVAASQCNQDGLADSYGLGTLIERSVFSDCPIGELKCPADKVLQNVISPAPLNTTAAPPVDEDCSCTPPVYCNAVFGDNLLQEKMFQCDVPEICCPRDLIHTVLDRPTQAPASPIDCGIRKEVVLNKLSGSSQTTFSEFPWMVLILERVNNEEKPKCGASLVASSLVLTAAHCVQDKNINSLIIRAGEYNLNVPSASEEQPHQDRTVKNISIHTNFFRKALLHDLAFIELNEPFQYASNVATVCLPLVKTPYSPEDTSIYDLSRCVATGWGSKETNDPTVQSILSKIDLKIIPSDQCQNSLRKSPLGPKFVLHPSLICAMGQPGTDTCKGDGGGPLACPLISNPNKYVQVGVIAGGLNCSSPYPSLYASLLLKNSDWITEEIYIRNIFLNP